MNQISTHRLAGGCLVALVLGGLSAVVSVRSTAASASVQLTCPDFPDTVFIGEYPANEDMEWTNNVQGVAHDAGHWFFTTQSDTFVIKLPVEFDLNDDFDPEDSSTWPSGAKAVPIPTSLEDKGFAEFKDLDQANGFLLVPVAGEDPDTDANIGGIAVFTTADLTYRGLYRLTEVDHPSFAAFNVHGGYLLISRPTVSKDESPHRYTVNFDLLAAGNVADAFTHAGQFELTEGGAGIDPPMSNMQGAAFTPWGDLYLVNGLDDPSEDRGGIHLFNPAGELIDESTNGSGTFNFAYRPSIFEEPEGADWWNRDVGPAAPGIGGQLHVILLDNELDEDNIYFKHYAVDYSCIAAGDNDGDGLTNGEEIYTTDTDPLDADTDNDGLSDGVEVNALGTDPKDTDSDDDSVADGDEDADLDGLSNSNEVNVYHTDPTQSDTDGDQLTDGDEVNIHQTDPLVKDTDGDDLTDGEEVLEHGSDPLDADSDDDGLTDGDEVNVYGTDPTDADTDDDLLGDGIEVTYGTNPLVADTDGDGLLDGQDVEFIQNALLSLPLSSFKPPGLGTRTAMLSLLDSVENKLLAGAVAQALEQLRALRMQIDGCGTAPDGSDRIRTCSAQIEVRKLVDLLVANLS